MPGTIGLVYDSPDLAEVLSRLRSTTGKASVGGDGSDHSLEGTKFALRETGNGDAEEKDSVEVICPYGGYRVGENSSGCSSAACLQKIMQFPLQFSPSPQGVSLCGEKLPSRVDTKPKCPAHFWHPGGLSIGPPSQSE